MIKLNFKQLTIFFTLILLFIFITFSPNEIGIGGVMLVYIILYFWFYSLLGALIAKTSIKSTNILLAILAFLPTSLIALTSLGQLSLNDLFLLSVLQVIAVFYWIRRRKH